MIADLATGFVAILHVGFLVLEMILWDTPFGRKTFGLTREIAAQTSKLASNQGLYNGFLAAGLFYGLMTDKVDFKIFHLSCVVIAGLWGAWTVKSRILYIQSFPAIVALALLHFGV